VLCEVLTVTALLQTSWKFTAEAFVVFHEKSSDSPDDIFVLEAVK